MRCRMKRLKHIAISKSLIFISLPFLTYYGCKSEKLPPPDLDYVKNHLAEFRGVDLNNNTLDDEKIEPKILELHDDPYVQKVLLRYAQNRQFVIENPENLKIIQDRYSNDFLLQKCLFLLLPTKSIRYVVNLTTEAAFTVIYSKERKSLLRLAGSTLSGHALSMGKGWLDENGKLSNDPIDAWNVCPFKMPKTDFEKYHNRWVKNLKINKGK